MVLLWWCFCDAQLVIKASEILQTSLFHIKRFSWKKSKKKNFKTFLRRCSFSSIISGSMIFDHSNAISVLYLLQCQTPRNRYVLAIFWEIFATKLENSSNRYVFFENIIVTIGWPKMSMFAYFVQNMKIPYFWYFLASVSSSVRSLYRFWRCVINWAKSMNTF